MPTNNIEGKPSKSKNYKRKIINFTEIQVEEINRRAKDAGVGYNEYLRRILDRVLFDDLTVQK